MECLRAALLLVIHMIFVLKVMELALLMNVSDSAWGGLVWCGPEPAITVINLTSADSSHKRCQL